MAGVRVVCETNEVMTSFRFARVCPSRGIPINRTATDLKPQVSNGTTPYEATGDQR